jgi:integrin beta 3
MVPDAIAAIPAPQNGRDGRDGVDGKDGSPGEHGKDGAPGRDGLDGKDGLNGMDGKDGVGLAGAFQNKDGRLILTLTNGATADVGEIAGKDGRDGTNGKDGRDALGFDDLTVEHDGDRGFTFRMERGEQVKEFSFTVPVVLDRGVWNEGREGGYAKGDGVTWGGSFWIAQKDSPEGKPDSPDSGWRLAVKRGQNGKDVAK